MTYGYATVQSHTLEQVAEAPLASATEAKQIRGGGFVGVHFNKETYSD